MSIREHTHVDAAEVMAAAACRMRMLRGLATGRIRWLNLVSGVTRLFG